MKNHIYKIYNCKHEKYGEQFVQCKKHAEALSSKIAPHALILTKLARTKDPCETCLEEKE